MPTTLQVLLAVLLVVSPASVASTSTASASTVSAGTATSPETDESAHPSIVAVYPNPVADKDVGEYVVIEFPKSTNVSNWTLTDGKTTAELPNTTVSGHVAFSTDPYIARNVTDHPVRPLDGRLPLANGGETLELRADNRTVASTTYTNAPESELWRPAGGEDGGQWTPLGRTNRMPVESGPASIRAFVLPDAPDIPINTLESAEKRILLAGYTFTSRAASRHLREAVDRGVTVRVLVEDSPVGGISQRQAEALDSLVAAGIDVQVLGGPRARYRYHHPKYAVVDDRALVLTENWKPSGVGGHSNRGWGVLVDDTTIATELAAIFEADADWRDTIPWQSFRESRDFQEPESANGTYSVHHPARNLTAESVSVAIAPDNAEGTTLDLINSAEESIRVEQVAIGSRRQPFVRATLDAAARGVKVRVLLSSAWYVREENERLVEWLNGQAEIRNLSLDARLVDPRSRFEKVHAKGLIVDEERVVVGSMNWNNNSARENREVMVVLEGKEVGKFYASVFDADWKRGSGSDGYPVGLAIAVVVGLVAARLVASEKVTFE